MRTIEIYDQNKAYSIDNTFIENHQKEKFTDWERTFFIRNLTDQKIAIVSLNIFERIFCMLQNIFCCRCYSKFETVFKTKNIKVISPSTLNQKIISYPLDDTRLENYLGFAKNCMGKENGLFFIKLPYLNSAKIEGALKILGISIEGNTPRQIKNSSNWDILTLPRDWSASMNNFNVKECSIWINDKTGIERISIYTYSDNNDEYDIQTMIVDKEVIK